MEHGRILLAVEKRMIRDGYLDANFVKDKVRTAMLFLQDSIIERITGRCLYGTLEDMICTDTVNLPENEMYAVLLNRYLFPVFVYGVPAETGIPMSFQDRNAGRVQHVDDSYQAVSLSDVKLVNQHYLERVDFYIHRAIRFLRCNKGCFPVTCACPCDCADAPYQRGLPTGVNTNYMGRQPGDNYNRGYKGWRGGYELF